MPPGDERLPVSGAHVRAGLKCSARHDRLAGPLDPHRSAHESVAVETCGREGVCRACSGVAAAAAALPGAAAPALASRPARRCRPPDAPAAAPSGTVTLPTGYPERPFVRVEFDKLTWRPTEGNKLGVETAVVEGDPSKPGYYLTINHFPAGVMSRPHYHPDERYVIVLRGYVAHRRGRGLPAEADDPAEARRLHATSQGRPALRRRTGRGHLGRDQRLRSDEGHRHRRRRAVRTVSLGPGQAQVDDLPRMATGRIPQIHVAESRMMASGGSTMVGSSRASKRMSRGP